MNEMVMKPEPGVKSLWNFINNMLLFFAVLVACIMLLAGMHIIGVAALLGLWVLVLYLPFAIYIPAFYRSLEYALDSEAIRMQKGVFWRKRSTVPYTKVTNIDILQGPVERLFKICHLQIQTAGYSGNQTVKAELIMVGIRDGEAVKEQIMARLRGRIAAPEPVSAPVASEAELLRSILNELSALRKELSHPQS